MRVDWLKLVIEKQSIESLGSFNPFSTGTHLYHRLWLWLDDFIEIRKDVWRSEDQWADSVLFQSLHEFLKLYKIDE